ncbi:DNA/RNA nuclease SfsA [Luminiphilus syltensis]|nr:DNA/RNA nuclease SfsA [Luminiphilus syltensis]
MDFPKLQAGVLERRYKRFLADVLLPSGERVVAHCPNTGAMTGCAEPGSRVWLSHSDNPRRKLSWTWELVETESGMACIHSARANAVVREAIESQLIDFAEDCATLRSEVKFGAGSRVDLMAEWDDGRRQLIEVKAVTLCRDRGVGVFPDAVSVRAKKHIKELMAVRDANTRVALVFCVFHEGIERVAAAGDIDPDYAHDLAAAAAGGLELLALKVSLDPRHLVPDGLLPVLVD